MFRNKKNLKFHIILVLLLPILVSCGWENKDTSSLDTRNWPLYPVEVKLHSYMDVLFTVAAQVGAETVPFIFDTGGGITIIDPELANRTGHVPFGRITGFRMDGERIDIPRGGKVEFQVEGTPIIAETFIFDVLSLIPGDWPKIGGLFALDTFRDHIVTLELSRERLIIESEQSFKERIASMKPLNIRIGHQAGGWGLDIFVEVEAETGSLWLELDTGNVSDVFLAPHALRQLGLKRPPAGDKEDSSSYGVFKTALNIAGFFPIEVTARERELIYDGVLNAAAIEKLVLTMDLHNGRMWASFAEPGEESSEE